VTNDTITAELAEFAENGFLGVLGGLGGKPVMWTVE